MQDAPDREMSTSDVGKVIMRRLKAIDKVAYVRFASVYLEFEDVSAFMTELSEPSILYTGTIASVTPAGSFILFDKTSAENSILALMPSGSPG